MSLQIKLNGKGLQLENAINLLDLLKENGVKQPDMVSVQVNGEFLAKDNFASKLIAENDEIDFVYFMGGGC